MQGNDDNGSHISFEDETSAIDIPTEADQNLLDAYMNGGFTNATSNLGQTCTVTLVTGAVPALRAVYAPNQFLSGYDDVRTGFNLNTN